MKLEAQFEDPIVERYFNRETTKICLTKLKASHHDVIAFEAAGDFATSHFKLGDCIFPDPRQTFFGPEFESCVIPDDTDLASAEILSPDDDMYWQLWKYYFTRIYDEVFKPKISAGQTIMMLSRRLCLAILENGQEIPYPVAHLVGRRNEILDDIEGFVSNFSGIKILKTESTLLYTSKNAPFGGPWDFHPDRAYYVSLRQQMLKLIFPETRNDQAYLAEKLAGYERDISKLINLLEDMKTKEPAVDSVQPTSLECMLPAVVTSSQMAAE
jgi:hypothetical protein